MKRHLQYPAECILINYLMEIVKHPESLIKEKTSYLDINGYEFDISPSSDLTQWLQLLANQAINDIQTRISDRTFKKEL